MRILLINQYAGAPSLGMEYRPHWMALEWQKLGHEVLVVSGDYSHLRRSQPQPGRSTVEDVDFITLETPRYGGNGPRRFANIVAFRAQLYRALHELAKWRPDAVIASSTHPMDIRPGLRLARQSGAIFVHEIHDLWPLTPKLLGGMSDHHPMIMWMQREEDLACRESDLVISILPATLPYLQTRGLDPIRWVHVSNGVPEDAVLDVCQRAEATASPFRVGYFGGHGVSNDLGTLIEAARLLESQPFEFHLTGSGDQKAALQRQAAGLAKVSFHDEVQPSEARRQMQSMDCLVVAARRSPLYEHGVGMNKIFEYMAVGRPIIQAIDTPASPAEQAGCALRCRPGDPQDVAEAVRALFQLDPRQRAAMGQSGREYMRKRATYPLLSERFTTALVSAQRWKSEAPFPPQPRPGRRAGHLPRAS